MWNGSVALVDVFVSQWSGKQEQRSSKAHDDREHKVRFGVSMVAEPLEVLVEGGRYGGRFIDIQDSNPQPFRGSISPYYWIGWI